MPVKKREKWTEEDVLVLPLLEHDYFERKSGNFLQNKEFRKNFAKAISAFSNSGGGHLILGVQDDGIIDGVPEMNNKTRTRDWIEQIIPQSVSYELQDFRVHEVEPSAPSQIPTGKVVIVVDIGDSIFAPHQSSEDHLYYHRSGGRSRPAPHFYLEMVRARETYLNRNLVQVWFETVITPMLSNLVYEKSALIKKDWVWSHWDKTAKSIRYLKHDGESYSISDNQEQFLILYSRIEELINEHDAGAEHLVSQCRNLYEAVRDSAALRKIYRQTISAKQISKMKAFLIENGKNHIAEYDNERIISEFFFDADEQNNLETLADLIVNNKQKMEPGNRIEIFWNYFKDTFLNILTQPRISSKSELITTASERLIEINIELIEELRRVRQELGTRYGVPYSSPAPVTETSLRRW